MTTTAWTESDLAEIDRHDEVHIAPRRSDGALAALRTVWAVRVGSKVYIRSVNGAAGAWYRTASASHEGHLTSSGIASDVVFAVVDPTDALQDRIDAAYRSKYNRYPGPVARITADKARATTFEILPEGTSS
ncbi:DUF2255 family protein [Catenulispora rubra]|uniref:DUF2255 family protein n=1 Tax=Catenulispora rubra TaxID=280293 RepID=UPI001891FC47|nr:DUF2255 family protein [Catenulispora rubra]